MLNENDIIDILIEYYEGKGYSVDQRSNTSQKGIDIKFKKGEKFIYVEAKGATSSKKTVNYGKPFNSNQVNTHIAKAILQIVQIREQFKNQSYIIALPNNEDHRFSIDPIKNFFREINVKVLLVTDNREVIEYVSYL